jgi:hypothetical protein
MSADVDAKLKYETKGTTAIKIDLYQLYLSAIF